MGRGARTLFRNMGLIWKAILIYSAYALILLLVGRETYFSAMATLWWIGINMTALLVLCFFMIQLSRLQEGAKRLAAGELSYHVPTEHMFFALKQHGENLNSIGAGMTRAVEERIKSERLKTEPVSYTHLPIEDVCDVPYASQIPGVGHKCGHDGHSAALAAFAMEVDKNGCPNDVYFIFQPAEETGDGAIQCAPLITEEKIDEVFAFHNWPGYPLGTVCIRNGAINCASRGMTIRMVGTPSHASMPECGKNPAFAFAELVHGVPALLDLPWKALVLVTVIGLRVGAVSYTHLRKPRITTASRNFFCSRRKAAHIACRMAAS